MSSNCSLCWQCLQGGTAIEMLKSYSKGSREGLPKGVSRMSRLCSIPAVDCLGMAHCSKSHVYHEVDRGAYLSARGPLLRVIPASPVEKKAFFRPAVKSFNVCCASRSDNESKYSQQSRACRFALYTDKKWFRTISLGCPALSGVNVQTLVDVIDTLVGNIARVIAF